MLLFYTPLRTPVKKRFSEMGQTTNNERNSFEVKGISAANDAHSSALIVNIEEILLADPKFGMPFEIVFSVDN